MHNTLKLHNLIFIALFLNVENIIFAFVNVGYSVIHGASAKQVFLHHCMLMSEQAELHVGEIPQRINGVAVAQAAAMISTVWISALAADVANKTLNT